MKPNETLRSDEQTARRDFLKQVGKGMATAAPAIALLLAASSKPASAQIRLYGPDACDFDSEAADNECPDS
jgi:hypothetical protein